MNAEIYFPREGRSFGQTSENGFDETVKKLNDINVNIIYKTEVNLNQKSISEALKVSESGDEKIGLIMIADVLSEDSSEKAKEFFESIGILGKIQRIEAEYKDPDDTDTEKQNSSKSPAKKNKKSRKNKNADTEPIDITQSIITIENRPVYAYAVEYNNKLLVILPKFDVLNISFTAELYSVATAVANPSSKEAFWKRFIPCSGDRPLDVVRKIILILAICTFLVSSYILVQILVVEPATNDKMTDDIKDLLVSTTEGEKDDNGTPKKEVSKLPTDGSEGVISDFSQLLKANPDTIGWINVPNTIIDFVVVKPQDGVDSEYYLHRDFYGNYSKYGTVFMDYRSSLDAKNMIIHGHHMQDGRMFANLAYYVERGQNYGINFYKQTPTFTFNTIYEKSKWKIVAFFKTNTLESQGTPFNYLRGDFVSDYDFLDFVYNLRVRSLVNCPVDLNENDTILTLSTCAYDFDDFRIVIVARKVRDGESPDVDVSKAVENPSPLYPDVWYNTYGGSKPNVTSFQNAYNNGEIYWYDGEKQWSLNDDEELERVLNEGKKNAENMLRAFVEEIDYADEEEAQVDELVEEYIESFKNAESASEVNTLYNEVIAEIKKIKTREQVDAENSAEAEKSRIEAEIQASIQAQNELKAKRQSAVTEIRSSIAGNEYRIKQADEVTKLMEIYAKQINNATDIDEVEDLKKKCIEELAKIKTAEEMDEEESKAAEEASKKAAEEASKKAAEESRQAEEARKAAEKAAKELANARTEAIEEIESYVNPDDYPAAVKGKIQAIIGSAKSTISDESILTTVSAVENMVARTKQQIDECIEEISEPSPEEPPEVESSDESSSEETTPEDDE